MITVPASAAPSYQASGLSAVVAGTQVTASVTITSSTAVTAQNAGICARSSTNQKVDFPLTRNVPLTPKGTRLEGTRSLAAGEYTYWACAQVNSKWFDIGSKETLRVESASSSSRPAPSPAPQPAPGPTPSPAPAPIQNNNKSSMVGIAIPTWVLQGTTDAELAKRLDMIAGTGAGWVRLDVAASELEARQGQTNWSPLDRLVKAADARNLKILGLINTIPAWARPSGTAWNYGPSTASQRSAYSDFAKRAAQRYKGVVDAWELWNEPNLDQFWAPAPRAADYGLLIRDAYPAVKLVDPSVPVIAAGTGWAGTGDVDSVTWYKQIYDGGFQQYFDAASVHPYQDIGWSRAGQLFSGGEMGAATSVRSLMNSKGDGAKAIWGTEVGFPTAGGGNVTESEQAKWLAPMYEGWVNQTTSRGKTGPLFYYTLLDYDGSREGSFGLVRVDGSLKPAYTALRGWLS